jgi:hypothetical protein
MANPFGIEQVDVPGILGIYQGAQDRRVNQMLLQRKMAMEDRELAKHDTISSIWKNYQVPGQSKGGDPSSPAPAATPLPAPVAALAAGSTPSPLAGAYAAPSAPLADIPGVIAGVGESGAPLEAAAPAAAPGATPSPMGNLPPVNPASVTPEDQSFVQANEQSIRQLMGLDPEQGMQFLKYLQGQDSDKRAKIADAQDAIHTTAVALQNVPYPQRKAALLAQAPDLLAAHPGLTPQMLQNFDPTDQNIQVAIANSIGVKGMLEHAEKTAAMAETARHDRAEEANSANNGYLSAGLMPPGVPGAGSPIDGGGSASIPSSPQARVAQLTDTWSAIAPGTKPTSGLRTPAQQAALVRSGVTAATNSEHLSGNAIDVPIVKGQTPQSIEAAYAARGIPVRVIQESGVGAGQGTGPHFHIQRIGGGAAPASGPRIIPGGKLDHSADSTLLDDAGITYAAQIYAKTGQIPPLGQGKDAARLRAQIVGRAASLDAAGGITGSDRAGQMADYKADRAALTSLSRTASQVLAFEDTAKRNGALALEKAAKAGVGNTPIFNKWVNAGRKATGDPDVAAMNAAVETFANEYAKVVSGATGGAVTSDTARAHANSLINSAMSPAQLKSVMGTLFADMDNRKAGLEGQQNALRDRLNSGGGQGPVHIATASDYAKLPSGAHYIDPQGQPRIKR